MSRSGDFTTDFIGLCETKIGSLNEFPLSKNGLFTFLNTESTFVECLCSTIQELKDPQGAGNY